MDLFIRTFEVLSKLNRIFIFYIDCDSIKVVQFNFQSSLVIGVELR